MSVQVNPRETSAVAAVEHVLEAAQRTALDRLQLYVLELRLAAQDAAHAAALGAAGVTALLLGWICLMGASAVGLTQWLPWWTSLLCVGLLQCAIGGVLVWLSRTAAKRGLP